MNRKLISGIFNVPVSSMPNLKADDQDFSKSITKCLLPGILLWKLLKTFWK